MLLTAYLSPCEFSQMFSIFMKSNILEPRNDIVRITDWGATSTTTATWHSMCCQQRWALWRHHTRWAVHIWISTITSNMHISLAIDISNAMPSTHCTCWQGSMDNKKTAGSMQHGASNKQLKVGVPYLLGIFIYVHREWKKTGSQTFLHIFPKY